MSFGLVFTLTQVFAPLIVVVLLVASRRRADGPLIACAAVAILSFVALWLFSDSQSGLLFSGGPQDTLRFVLDEIAGATGQAAWVLALYPAALARHARWLAGLAAAQVVAEAALQFGSFPCFLSQITGDVASGACVTPSPAILHLITAAWLVSPAVALAYALRTRRVAPPRNPPSDPAMTQLGEAPEDEVALEVRTERL